MKMQNVLRSTRKGVIKAIPKAAGATLSVDEEILSFA
jgi:biotin carboxyl carrier protein